MFILVIQTIQSILSLLQSIFDFLRTEEGQAWLKEMRTNREQMDAWWNSTVTPWWKTVVTPWWEANAGSGKWKEMVVSMAEGKNPVWSSLRKIFNG